MAKRPRKKTSPKNSLSTLSGVFHAHPRGFGFVTPDNNDENGPDVFIPKHLTKNAVNGDSVEITVSQTSRSKKGPEGAIVSILKRARSTLIGIVEAIENKEIFAYCPSMGEQRPLKMKKEKGKKWKVGDRWVVEVIDWGEEKAPIFCKAIRPIGPIADPSKDIETAVCDFGIPSSFPDEVIEEAKAFGTKVRSKELSGRIDFTDLFTFTIDPDTAKDFDDALSVKKEPNGHYHLWVHIADVAHYVKPDSALDQEAILRSNSTYFPGVCVPMLPEELSNNLCSLKQGVVRLTVSVQMEFNPEGHLGNHAIHRAFIKSRKRLTYGEAKEILETKKRSSYHKPLVHMQQLCQLLKTQRAKRGSIDFALPELILMVDKNGKPTGTKIEPYHITHQIVEEFMLKANEVVATHLHNKGKELIFRIHEEPAKENMDAFFQTARALGFPLKADPTQKDIQALFAQAADSPFSHQLAVGFIRNLKLAFYSPRNVGHYGLALENYCHFTSPIRRYSDLIIGRLLFDEEPKDIDLEKISQSCSEKERISFRAEMSVKALKKHRLLLDWKKENPHRKYGAFITKIKPFGIYFEIKELFLEGFLHISDLKNDYFLFDQKRTLLKGEKTGTIYQMGQALTVSVDLIDLIHLETKWTLHDE